MSFSKRRAGVVRGVLVLALFVAGLASSVQAWASRPASEAESRELTRAISAIRKLGYPEVAVDLTAMMASGTLKVEDSFPEGLYADTSYPLTGRQAIRISSKIIPDLKNPLYERPKIGHLVLVEERVWLASILAHEWFHTQQASWWVHTVGRIYAVRERPAWEYQRDLLLVASVMMSEGDAAVQMRLQGLVDQAQVEIDNL